MDKENYEQLGTPTERKIGNTIYIVRAFGNKNAVKTALDLLIDIADKRLQNDIDSGEFYGKLNKE